MKPPKNKATIRQELQQGVDVFLNSGGEIQQIQRGISGREPGDNINTRIPLTQEKQVRTPLTDEINALDARKQKSKPEPTPKKQPRKKIIYDDFGEPLREVWE